MPFKHGAHHGISFIFSILVSVLLTELIRPLLPGVLKILDNASRFIVSQTKLHIDYKTVSILLVAFVVTIIYGIIYGLLERRRSS
ncbi:MAG: hypothetical protein IMZ61_06010 [Planctomycetes bacterium]|nr:hypothetical protein [Planctomycetota bacterium]